MSQPTTAEPGDTLVKGHRANQIGLAYEAAALGMDNDLIVVCIEQGIPLEEVCSLLDPRNYSRPRPQPRLEEHLVRNAPDLRPRRALTRSVIAKEDFERIASGFELPEFSSLTERGFAVTLLAVAIVAGADKKGLQRALSAAFGSGNNPQFLNFAIRTLLEQRLVGGAPGQFKQSTSDMLR